MSEIVRFTADYSDEHPAGEYVEYSEYEQLKQHELELMAMVKRLLNYCALLENEDDLDNKAMLLALAKKETPQQSLAEHDVAVVEKAKHVIMGGMISRQVTAEDFDQWIDLIKPTQAPAGR